MPQLVNSFAIVLNEKRKGMHFTKSAGYCLGDERREVGVGGEKVES